MLEWDVDLIKYHLYTDPSESSAFSQKSGKDHSFDLESNKSKKSKGKGKNKKGRNSKIFSHSYINAVKFMF